MAKSAPCVNARNISVDRERKRLPSYPDKNLILSVECPMKSIRKRRLDETPWLPGEKKLLAGRWKQKHG